MTSPEVAINCLELRCICLPSTFANQRTLQLSMAFFSKTAWPGWKDRASVPFWGNGNFKQKETQTIHLPTFTIFYHWKQPNVGKYTIHGWYGRGMKWMKILKEILKETYTTFLVVFSIQAPRNQQQKPLKNRPFTSFYPKKKVIFQPLIFRDYISFREGNSIYCTLYFSIFFQVKHLLKKKHPKPREFLSWAC